MRRVVVPVILAVALASADTLLVKKAPPRSRAEAYTLEGLSALGGTVGCGCVGTAGAYAMVIGVLGMAFGGPSPGAEGLAVAGLCVAGASAALLPAAAARCAISTGGRLGEPGSQGFAYGGAYAGAVAGVAVGALGNRVAMHTEQWVGIPFYVAGALLIPAGAVAGYNTNAWRGAEQGIGARFGPPGLQFTSVDLPDRMVEYGVKVQLAALRF
jgi:hypothetical protein